MVNNKIRGDVETDYVYVCISANDFPTLNWDIILLYCGCYQGFNGVA